MAKVKFNFDKKFIFWIVIASIGLITMIPSIIILATTHNSLIWLPASFGIALFIVGLGFILYYVVLEHKRKVVRNKSI